MKPIFFNRVQNFAEPGIRKDNLNGMDLGSYSTSDELTEVALINVCTGYLEFYPQIRVILLKPCRTTYLDVPDAKVSTSSTQLDKVESLNLVALVAGIVEKLTLKCLCQPLRATVIHV